MDNRFIELAHVVRVVVAGSCGPRREKVCWNEYFFLCSPCGLIAARIASGDFFVHTFHAYAIQALDKRGAILSGLGPSSSRPAPFGGPMVGASHIPAKLSVCDTSVKNNGARSESIYQSEEL